MPKVREIASFLTARGLSTSFHEVLRGLRMYKGLRQWQVAQETYMSEKTYERIEKGRDVTADELERLDHCYECDGELIDYRFGRIELNLGKKKSPAA